MAKHKKIDADEKTIRTRANISGKLVYLCLLNKLNQSDIGKILGVTRQSSSLYMNGLAQMPVDSLVKLAIHFGVSLDWLCGLTEDMHGHFGGNDYGKDDA